ncbi:MAG: acyltransferase family protein [Isosphaeraceae bacterium]
MQRIKELDSIRGLAALAIVLFHLRLPSVSVFGFAVDLFFVLSGYLITTIILSNVQTDGFLLSFYARRGLRIWPVYYLALAAVVLINGWLPTPGNLADLPYYLTYTQEAVHSWMGREPTFPVAFRHTWSLAIEEQFYILWPVIIWLAGRRGLHAMVFIMVGTAVSTRAWGVSEFVLITRCDGLALGGLLAALIGDPTRTPQVSSRGRTRFVIFSLVAPGAVLLALLSAGQLNAFWPGTVSPRMTHSLKMLWVNLVLFATTGAIVLHSGCAQLSWLRNPALMYLGTISYGLYVYHHIIIKVWENLALHYGWPDNPIVELCKLGASIALAILSWHLVERPILALKKLFRYQPSRSFAGSGSLAGQRFAVRFTPADCSPEVPTGPGIA